MNLHDIIIYSFSVLVIERLKSHNLLLHMNFARYILAAKQVTHLVQDYMQHDMLLMHMLTSV